MRVKNELIITGMTRLRLLPADNIHRFSIIGHIQLAKILDALTRQKGHLRTPEIGILVCPYGRIGSYNHAFDIISPILTRKVLERSIIFGALQDDMGIVGIKFVIFEYLNETVFIYCLHFHIRGIGR